MWVHDLCEWILKWVFVWEEQLQVSHSSYLQATCVSEMRERGKECVRAQSKADLCYLKVVWVVSNHHLSEM